MGQSYRLTSTMTNEYHRSTGPSWMVRLGRFATCERMERTSKSLKPSKLGGQVRMGELRKEREQDLE